MNSSSRQPVACFRHFSQAARLKDLQNGNISKAWFVEIEKEPKTQQAGKGWHGPVRERGNFSFTRRTDLSKKGLKITKIKFG